MNIAYYIALICVLMFGLYLNILGLPGLWLMVIALVCYALATGWDLLVGWPSMIALIVLASAAEVVEFVAGAAGSAAAGGRKRAMFGAVVGSFIGGIMGTPIFPVVGTIVGACAGAFVGSAAIEIYDRDPAHAFRIGIGAAKGRFWGIVIKLAFGVVMFVVAAITAAA